MGRGIPQGNITKTLGREVNDLLSHLIGVADAINTGEHHRVFGLALF